MAACNISQNWDKHFWALKNTTHRQKSCTPHLCKTKSTAHSFTYLRILLGTFCFSGGKVLMNLWLGRSIVCWTRGLLSFLFLLPNLFFFYLNSSKKKLIFQGCLFIPNHKLCFSLCLSFVFVCVRTGAHPCVVSSFFEHVLCVVFFFEQSNKKINTLLLALGVCIQYVPPVLPFLLCRRSTQSHIGCGRWPATLCALVCGLCVDWWLLWIFSENFFICLFLLLQTPQEKSVSEGGCSISAVSFWFSFDRPTPWKYLFFGSVHFPFALHSSCYFHFTVFDFPSTVQNDFISFVPWGSHIEHWWKVVWFMFASAEWALLHRQSVGVVQQSSSPTGWPLLRAEKNDFVRPIPTFSSSSTPNSAVTMQIARVSKNL